MSPMSMLGRRLELGGCEEGSQISVQRDRLVAGGLVAGGIAGGCPNAPQQALSKYHFAAACMEHATCGDRCRTPPRGGPWKPPWLLGCGGPSVDRSLRVPLDTLSDCWTWISVRHHCSWLLPECGAGCERTSFAAPGACVTDQYPLYTPRTFDWFLYCASPFQQNNSRCVGGQHSNVCPHARKNSQGPSQQPSSTGPQYRRSASVPGFYRMTVKKCKGHRRTNICAQHGSQEPSVVINVN